MANKKICFFIDSLFKNGKEQRMTSLLANALVDNKYDVSIIIRYKERVNYNLYDLSRKIKIIKLDYKNKKVSYYKVLRNINRRLGLFKKRTKLISKFYCNKKIINDLNIIFYENKYDAVIGVSGDNSYIISNMVDTISSKIIYWNYNDFDKDYINKKSKYINEDKYIRPLIKNFYKVVCFNKDDVLKFKENYFIDTIDINNIKSFETKEKTKFTNHKLLTIIKDKKEYDELFDIMKEFHKSNKKFKLNIYGNKEDTKYVNNKINQNNLDKCIKYSVIKYDFKDTYLKNDVYLDLSNEEFNINVLDALECGLPVISYKSILIKDNVNGKIVDSEEAYIISLVDLVSDKKNLSKYQKNIDKTIKEYSIDKVVSKWISVIDN